MTVSTVNHTWAIEQWIRGHVEPELRRLSVVAAAAREDIAASADPTLVERAALRLVGVMREALALRQHAEDALERARIADGVFSCEGG